MNREPLQLMTMMNSALPLKPTLFQDLRLASISTARFPVPVIQHLRMPAEGIAQENNAEKMTPALPVKKALANGASSFAPKGHSVSTKRASLPTGKPLAPAPVLGHFQKFHKKQTAVKKNRYCSHVTKNFRLKSTKLNAEELLFVEAAASLKKAASPRMSKALPPPPFPIAFAA